MAKKRKTRKEKVRSAGRQSTQHHQSSSPKIADQTRESVYTFDSSSLSPVALSGRKIPSEQLFFLREDLLRTIIVTGAIIITEITLYILLLNR